MNRSAPHHRYTSADQTDSARANHPIDGPAPGYDVLFVGEQTSLVMRLIAKLVERGRRPAILNGARLADRLSAECGVIVDHFVCPTVQLPGRYRAPWLQRLEWVFQRRHLRCLMQRIRPAVVHLNYIREQQAMFAELGDLCPGAVATVWGTDLNRDAAQSSAAQRSRIARVLDVAEVVTADSIHLLERARRLAPGKKAERFRLVLWGIDLPAFELAGTDPRVVQWRQQLSLEPHRPVVMAPRRINPRYDPQRVLHAFARSPTARQGYLVFKIFGDNPRTEASQQAMLTEVARTLGVSAQLRFAPPCPYQALPGLYRLADVACFLLSHDGTPTTAFEFMAAGIPVVAADIPDYRGMLVDGQHARLVPPDDAAAAAVVLEQILNRPDSMAGQCRAARQWVEAHATIDHTAHEFESCYALARGRTTRPSAGSRRVGRRATADCRATG